MDRRSKKRNTGEERRNELSRAARLRPAGPAHERRTTPRTPGDKQRVTVQLPSEVVERLRNAVYWTPGMTLTGLVEQCIIDKVDRMESDRGESFPVREKALRAGRPPK